MNIIMADQPHTLAKMVSKRLFSFKSEPVLGKDVEELVSMTRLKSIEKEHKSYGSLIDTRQLFPLAEPTRPEKISIADDISIGSSSVGSAIGSKSHLKPEDYDISVESSFMQENYETEELIWKKKTLDATYFNKRVFADPELRIFYENLTTSQRTKYKALTVKALHKLCNRYRHEMKRTKNEMDTGGIFHPTANEHRVHCMYLMKLHKGITAHTVELQAVKKLYRDYQTKQEAKVVAEHEKERLMNIANQRLGRTGEGHEPQQSPTVRADSASGNRAKVVSKGSTTVGTPSSAKKRPPSNSGVSNASFAGSSSTSAFGAVIGSKPAGGSAALMAVLNSNIVDGASSGSGNAVKGKVVPTSREVSSIGGISKEKEAKERSKDKERTREKERESTDLSDAGAPIASTSVAAVQHADKIMFNKVKQRRLGGVDPSLLMPEDAEKLETAEIVPPKRIKFRSSLLESSNAKWMLEKLREVHGDGFHRADSGNAELDSLDDDDVGDDDKTISRRQKNAALTSQLEVISFDDFMNIFNQCRPAASQTRKFSQLRNGDNMAQILGSGNSRSNTQLPSESELSTTVTMAGKNVSKPFFSMASAASLETKDGYAQDSDDREQRVAEIDAVGFLAETDPLLDTFLQAKAAVRDKAAERVSCL